MTQIAASVGSDRVTFALNRAVPVWIDGVPSTLNQANSTITLAGGAVTELSPNTYQVTWNTGEVMTVTAVKQSDSSDQGRDAPAPPAR